MKTNLIAFLLFGCFSCISTDTKEFKLSTPVINLFASSKLVTIDKGGAIQPKGIAGILALSISEKQLITLEYLNEYGLKGSPELIWTIEKPSVASVANNEITGLTPGTTQVGISSGGASASISLTVVGDANAVASVVVAPPASTNLQINGTSQLSAVVKNISNVTLLNKTIEWFSENETILSVSSNGLVTAKADGVAEVHAKVEGVKSNLIKFNIGTAAGVRTGTFQSAGGYSTVGSVTAEETGGKLVVKLSSNFQASVALGTFIYLANSTSGGNVKTLGLDLGSWSSGAKTFDVPGVTLNEYKYVVVLCKPAGITFGFAELKP
jgi:Bacterial Ig-like domain (group 2)